MASSSTANVSISASVRWANAATSVWPLLLPHRVGSTTYGNVTYATVGCHPGGGQAPAESDFWSSTPVIRRRKWGPLPARGCVRDGDVQGRPDADRAGQLHPAAEYFEAVFEADEPGAFAGGGAADSVV